MSKKDEQALIGRAMMEADFRKRLLAEPEATAKAEGLDVSPEFLTQFKGLDAAAAEQVSRLIGAVFAQPGMAELSENDMAAVTGGVGVAGLDGLRPPNPNVKLAPHGGLKIPDRLRAPTTW